MAKFSNIRRLSKQEQQELFIDFAKALSILRSSVEAAQFIKDLLSESEALMLARRLKIANLLSEDFTYAQIRKVMKVSDPTIAKVQTWLRLYGEGYRIVIKRTKSSSSKANRETWINLKRKYPMYYWPELLLKEIIKSANQREKQRLLGVLDDLKEKTKLSKELEQLLKPFIKPLSHKKAVKT